MICRMLLLLILISSVCAATFVVNVTQSSYQAEENHNITLEWTFTTKPDVSWRFLFIICNLITDHKFLTLYHVHEGVEVPESQDGQFAGRVQSDKDVLREGRIRLHVSRLRTNDSGLYVCGVKTDYGFSSEKCQLNVTGSWSFGFCQPCLLRLPPGLLSCRLDSHPSPAQASSTQTLSLSSTLPTVNHRDYWILPVAYTALRILFKESIPA
ncbi:uncharacterized protein LOC121639811 isoform X1 [Melanotaenia boesemani]|uniref:uncharacterized protein LOC121639811 isoform X1 n=1 Tax=Melanotaenia boesemani TaxID=1250792 RepID=UPI001C03C5BF|nr:uncharacterized protein LOC121639811 isoform X1 [Melanotaenia boesemani]